VAGDLEGAGREREAQPDLVQPDAQLASRRHASVGGERQDAAAGDGVAVDRGHHRAGEREDLQHHAVEQPDEVVEPGRSELVERDEVEPGREEALEPGQYHAAGARPSSLLQRGGDRRQARGVEGVPLPAGEADLGHAVALGEGVAHYLKIEKLISFSVRNSSSTGTPSRVLAMPRLIAGTISSGRLIRSP
jgi:hypothetical protein